jgi:hypothetical protein
MTARLVHALVPYSRFLEYQDRRSRVAAELVRRDQPPSLDADVKPAPTDKAPAQPLTGAETS